MTNIIFVSADGEETAVEAENGETVMSAALNGFVDGILAECGGACACATCHVYLDEALYEKMDAPSLKEEGMLEGNDNRKPTSRLSCQLTVSPLLEGARLLMPEEQY